MAVNMEQMTFQKIPEALRIIPKWVGWKFRWNEERERYSKVPYKLDGSYPQSFYKTYNYQAVVDAFIDGNIDGIGFALKDTGYLCLDFDGDSLNDIPSELRMLENHTYAEISPSGNGIHVWFKAEFPGEKNNQGKSVRYTKKEGYKTEWFYNTGFVTMTGNAVSDLDIDDSEMIISYLFDSTEGAEKEKSPNQDVKGISHSELDDSVVLERASKNKNTLKLINGDIANYPSPSDADYGLCKDFAKITSDPVQIERIMRRTELYRGKWDEHPTYLAGTIEKAILNTSISENQFEMRVIDQNNDQSNWKAELTLTDKGAIKNTRRNIKIILNNDKNVKDIGRTNIFSGHREIFKKPFWRKDDDPNYLWADSDEEMLRVYLDEQYGISSAEKTSDVLGGMFYQNSYHPVKDYLNGAEWDGKSRIETLFIDYLGAEDNKYTRTVTRKIMTAAVARVFDPGCKFDEALILVGEQGVGKSYVLSRLGGEWFNESVNTFSGDEALMKLRNSWIIELAELSAMKASEVEEVKGFISAKEDTYRPKYGRNIQKFPRQCVFFGSTNNYEFLKDRTGNRRFWPINVSAERRTNSPFEELTDAVVEQLWAEAVHLYRMGEKLFLDDEEVRAEAARLQGAHTTDDGLAGMIEKYLEDEVATCARQIWHECLMNDKQPKRHEIQDINQVLRNLPNWKQTPNATNHGRYGKQRGFIRID